MDEIIIINKLTWDAQSNDIFGYCANHPIQCYQLNNYLSVRKMSEAMNNQSIHPATETLVVALTDMCDKKNKIKIAIAIPICSHSLADILEKVIKHIYISVPKINSKSAVISLATDGDTNRRKTLNLLRSNNQDLDELKW